MLRDVDLSTLQKELGAEGETAQLDQVEAASWPVHGVCPRMVHVPATAEALASALARCDRAGAAVIPWGGEVTLFGRQISLSLSNINVGVLYILAISSISVYGIVLAGWSSNNKYSTLGGLRATAQMISYELALGLAFLGPIMLAGSMSLTDIVQSQKHIWNIVYQPLGALIYMVATIAEVNRAPFDMPEAEQELTAGYHVEYSGMKFALFFMAEYIKMIAISMIGASLFLGGYQGPFLDQLPWLGPIYLLIKVLILLFGLIWIRATFPRIRYDRLMAFGWKILFPLALLNVLVTAAVVLLVGG